MLEVNKCIVLLHYNASGVTTIVKILLLSTARNASNIHLGKFGITLWCRRPSASSAPASIASWSQYLLFFSFFRGTSILLSLKTCNSLIEEILWNFYAVSASIVLCRSESFRLKLAQESIEEVHSLDFLLLVGCKKERENLPLLRLLPRPHLLRPLLSLWHPNAGSRPWLSWCICLYWAWLLLDLCDRLCQLGRR